VLDADVAADVAAVLLLMLMACAPSRHRVRLASASSDLPGTVESVDSGSASVVQKISSRARRVPG